MVDSHKPDTSVAHLELSAAKGVEDLKSLFLSLAVHLPFFLHFFPLASFGTYFFLSLVIIICTFADYIFNKRHYNFD